jgi:hypothetical protein
MSKITAVAYYGGIPPDNNNLEKPQILDNFCKGVAAAGDIAIAHRGMDAIPCDVALIQGFVHDTGKKLPHLKLRQDAVTLQKQLGKRSLIVDSNLLLYADPGNLKRYLRYSFDGVFPTTGFYFDRDIDPSRWNKISSDLGISLKDYRSSGDHILICLQRNGGWSMQGLAVQEWLDRTILEIRKFSNRKIIVRKHPGDKKISKILKIKFPNVVISPDGVSLVADLKNAWATIVFNSSPAVASLIEGVPTFVTDPNPQNSQAYGVCNVDLSNIESPTLVDRQNWIEKLSMSHWNFDELRSGEAWNFFKKYI